MLVHVLNKHGQPLMPCGPRKARLLLRARKATPVKGRTGYFTIQLVYGSSGYKQPVSVGINTGSKRAPIAAISGYKVLYAKEKLLRTDVRKQLSDRSRYRRNRRGRLRYRKPRFDNRVKTKCARCAINNVPRREKGNPGRAALCRPCQGKEGRAMNPHILAPSVKNRADSILGDIYRLSQSLPITRIIVETAAFDTQKMSNPKIQGEEYQKGTLFGCEVWYYLIQKFGNKCAYCSGASEDRKLQLGHVFPKSRGGSEKVSNLVPSCRTCTTDKRNMTLDQWEGILQIEPESKLSKSRLRNIPGIRDRSYLKRGFQYSALTQSYKNYLTAHLSRFIERSRISRLKQTTSAVHYSQIETTTGAETKFFRELLDIPNSQINNAMVTASGGQPFDLPDEYMVEKQIKKRRPAEYISPTKAGTPIVKRKWEREVFGFRLWDKVCCDHPKLGKVEAYVTGRRQSGSFGVGSLDTKNVLAELLGKKDASISYKKLALLRPQLSVYVREFRDTERVGEGLTDGAKKEA